MAVVQISRIQVRRGKAKAGTGIPQLASGEMAWALDTQQLYIGNGSVAEGSPATGNTKILTENDLNGQGNLLDAIQYIYKDGSIIQTGPSVNDPVERSTQARLDDRVTLTEFISATELAANNNDYTPAIQRAINQLFLNSGQPSYTSTPEYTLGTLDAVATRVVLELPPGRFKTTTTLYVPSYVTIVGAGQDKTIIDYSGTGTAIRFVNDTSTIGTPSAIGTTEYTNQPRFITVSDLTVYSKSATQTALQLDCVRDSIFENLVIIGDWAGVTSTTSKALALHSLSPAVTCERNRFSNIKISGFQTAVYAPGDIARNKFDNMYVNNVYDAFIFGAQFVGITNQLAVNISVLYGPRNNTVTNSVLGDSMSGIKRHAMFVGKGANNSISDSNFINVGNSGSGSNFPTYPQVYFTTVGNTLRNVSSDRFINSAKPGTLSQYVPESAGTVDYNSFGTLTAAMASTSGTAFRLPLSTSQDGIPRGRNSFVINYIFKSTAGNNFVRQGTLYITADADHAVAQLTDDYNFAGINNMYEMILDFRVTLVDANNVDTTDPQSVASLAIKYSNVPNSGVLYYSYSSATYDSNI